MNKIKIRRYIAQQDFMSNDLQVTSANSDGVTESGVTAVSTIDVMSKIQSQFYGSYKAYVGFQTAVVLGSILMITVVYLLYKIKCRKPLRRRFRKVLVYMKNVPPPKETDHKCVGTTGLPEAAKGSWICIDNPNIAPSVEIDALKATALWIMQNHQDHLQNLQDVSGIILRVDPEVIHAHDAKEKAAWMSEHTPSPFACASTPICSDSNYRCNSAIRPVCGESLQIPNICIETPRPTQSNAAYVDLPPFTVTTTASQSNNVVSGNLADYSVEQSRYAYNDIRNLPIGCRTILRHQPMSVDATCDSMSDSLTEDEPLLSPDLRIHRYGDDAIRPSRRGNVTRTSERSLCSSPKSIGSSCNVDGRSHKLSEFLPTPRVKTSKSWNNVLHHSTNETVL